MARRRTEYARREEAEIPHDDVASPEEQRLRAIDACANIITRAEVSAFHLDGHPRLRATWWIDYMMETPYYPSELPVKTYFGNGKDHGFIDAYLNRVTHCLGKYYRLPEDDQRYIVAAREDNIRWRGDDSDRFRRIADTTLVWRDLDDEQKQAMKDGLKRGGIP